VPKSLSWLGLALSEISFPIFLDFVTIQTLLSAISQQNFHHVQLPHPPWRYLPNGVEYNHTEMYGHGNEGDDRWTKEQPWILAQAYQQHLLQAAYADYLLGQLLDILEARGLYDDVLLVVAADHGASFRAGVNRRDIEIDNAWDIANVPLFIKIPGQTEGLEFKRFVQVIDILPTILEVLDSSLPWDMDGTSLFDENYPNHTQYRVAKSRSGVLVEAVPEGFEYHHQKQLRSMLYGATERVRNVYAVGDGRALVGRAVSEYTVKKGDETAALINQLELLSVDLGSKKIPARIVGSLEGGNG